MDANPNSSNFFGDRLAELISKTIKKQLAQSDKSSVLQPRLEQMVEQQQQTNTQLSHLVKYMKRIRGDCPKWKFVFKEQKTVLIR